MEKSIRTVTLKLYRPSKLKRSIIDEAMLNYTKAYQYLLDKARTQIDDIRANYVDKFGKYNGQSVIKWMNKEIDKELNRFGIEPFKDSIKIDFSGNLAEYLNSEIKSCNTVYPCAYISPEEEERRYKYIMQQVYDRKGYSEDLEKRIDRLVIKAHSLRPIYFCRYASNRNYSILYDEERDRYYAKIYLVNSKNENRKKPDKIYKRKLFYIDKDKKSFFERGNRRTFLLFPLCFGKWQENFLKEAANNPEIIKSARLIKRSEEYYLAVNIVKEIPRPIEAINYMGISRGIDNSIYYSVVDAEGSIVTTGAINENNKYKLANNLVQIAGINKCRVIMERLADKGDKLSWKDDNGRSCLPVMDRIEYNCLVNILSYKIPYSGLPNLVRVSSTNIFYCCPNCGINSRVNRFSNKIFMCTSCGTTMDIEKAGSINLAKRLLKYNNDTVKIQVETTEKGVKFTNRDLEFEFYPSNPYNCADEFREEINYVVERFYSNIKAEVKKKNYKKKLSIIKKIESNRRKEIFELVSIS